MKSKIHISLSSPMRTSHEHGDFITVLEDPLSNKESTKNLIRLSDTKVILDHLFHVGFTRDREMSHVLVDPDSGLTQLWSLVKTEANPILGRDVLTERAIWSDKRDPRLRGLARDMYLKYYVHNFGILLSSEEHYTGGENMWLKLCEQAKHLGYHCYSVSLSAVEELVDVKVSRESIWGKSEAHKDTRLLISKYPLDKTSSIPNFSAVANSIVSKDFPVEEYSSILSNRAN